MYSRGRRGAPAKGVGRVNRRESSNLSISANQVRNSDVVDFFFCYQRIFWGLGVRFEGKTGRFGFGGIRDTNRLGDEKERKWGKNDRKMCE